MSPENIKDKIKKLLALSEDNPSEAESYSALQKAQELMAKYKLSELDIKGEEKEIKCIRRRTNFSYGTRSSDHYINELATLLADNFCCVNYVSTPRGSRTHYVCFMGMEEDVSICEEAMATANRAIIRGYNKVYKEVCKEYDMDYLSARYFNPLKTGYIDGYLDGLRKALADQKEEYQEWGLVLVAPQEAKDFLASLKSRDYNHTIYTDTTYYDKGYNDGSNFQMNKKIEGSDKQGYLS